jgi:ribosome modulation factor
MSNKTSLISKPVAQDHTGQGMKARVQKKRRDACPYSLNSEERHEWLEGYDGMSSEGGPASVKRA